MNLRFETAPPIARRTMEEALSLKSLRDQTDNTQTLTLNLREEEQAELEYYTLNPDEVGPTMPLRDRKPSGWCFVIQTSETNVFDSKYSLAHITFREGQFRFTHLQHGWIPAAILVTLQSARSGAWRKTGTFSPALLHLFGSRSLAIWFRGSSEKQDRIVPLVRRLTQDQSSRDAKGLRIDQFSRRVTQLWKQQSHFQNAPLNPGLMPPQFNL